MKDSYKPLPASAHLTNPVDISSTLVMTLPDIQVSFDNQAPNEPVLCYVYLGEKIQDVRSITKDETRIKIVSATHEETFEKFVTIQAKYTNNISIGFLRVQI